MRISVKFFFSLFNKSQESWFSLEKIKENLKKLEIGKKWFKGYKNNNEENF